MGQDAKELILPAASSHNVARFARIYVAPLVITLFFLSGASSLVYEILWMRMFTQVFGNTTSATSIVLSAFMAGLAIGSYWIGSFADRRRRNPLKLYAYLEGMIGVFGLAMPLLIQKIYTIYRWIFLNYQHSSLLMDSSRFVLSFLLILIPTILMGATLPVLSKQFVRSRQTLTRWVGLLYGINTFGAVAGSFVSGFFLVAWLGVTKTIYTAAAVNFIIALFALLVGSLLPDEQAHTSALPTQDVEIKREHITDDLQTNTARKLLLLICFVAGLTSLAYEVIWTRLLVFVLDSTVYAFCTMLTTFLFGIALGGLLISSFSRRIKSGAKWVGILEVLIGFSGFATIAVFANMPALDAWLRRMISHVSYGGWWTRVSLKFIEAFLIMLVPTILMGMVFPLICRVYTSSIKKLGGSIGVVYALNTCGAVLGSLAAGFLLIPLIGSAQSLAIIALIGAVCGGALLLAGAYNKAARLTSFALLVLVLCAGAMSFLPNVFSSVYNMHEQGSKLVYFHEGKSGTVTIHLYPAEERLISVNGTNVAGTQFSLHTTQKLQAHVPMLIHGNARRVLQIGFGSGESCHVLSLYPVERIDLVEIDPDVIRTSEQFFADLNHGISYHPLFNPIIMDGKNYALLTDEKYDVIMNDSTFPGKSGSSSLYTRDHFLACRRLLNDDGVMSSWVPFEIRPQEFQNIVRTFQSVFPYTTLWLANNCRNKHMLMVGTKQPFAVDFDRVVELMNIPAVKADLREVRLASPFTLLGSLVLAPPAVEVYSMYAPMNTDDHPTLEFACGRYPTRTAYWAANHQDLLRLRSSIISYLTFSTTPAKGQETIIASVKRQERANLHIDTARLYELLDEAHGDAGMFCMLTLERREEYEKALEINPDDINVRTFLAEGDASLNSLEQLAASKPEAPNVLYNLGRAYRGCRNYPAAIGALSKAVSFERNNTKYVDALNTTMIEFETSKSQHRSH